MPTISIIIPVYNAENTLKRCLDSITCQTFHDFEAILINDCSKDKSGDICDQIVSTDGRFKVIHLNKNCGVSNARNIGLNKAKGKYIMFVDSDDYVDKEYCNHMYKLISSNPTSFIVCNLHITNNKINYEQSLNIKEDTIIISSYYQLFRMNLSGYPVNKIYQKKIIDQHYIRFNTNMTACEDVVFNTSYFKYCNEILYTSKTLYYYWTNPNSTTNSFNIDALRLNLKAFAARYPLIETQYINEFCDTYFSCFIGLLNNIFHKKCPLNFLQKMYYNQRMISSSEFKMCANHLSEKKNHGLFITVVKTYNYPLLWLYQKCSSLKSTIRSYLWK